MSHVHYSTARRLARVALGDEKAEELFTTDDAWFWQQSDAMESYVLASEGDEAEAYSMAASAYCHRLVKKYPAFILKGFNPDECEMDDEDIVDDEEEDTP